MRNFLDDSVWDKMNLRCLGGHPGGGAETEVEIRD